MRLAEMIGGSRADPELRDKIERSLYGTHSYGRQVATAKQKRSVLQGLGDEQTLQSAMQDSLADAQNWIKENGDMRSPNDPNLTPEPYNKHLKKKLMHGQLWPSAPELLEKPKIPRFLGTETSSSPSSA